MRLERFDQELAERHALRTLDGTGPIATLSKEGRVQNEKA
jgi:hypothetical protein